MVGLAQAAEQGTVNPLVWVQVPYLTLWRVDRVAMVALC